MENEIWKPVPEFEGLYEVSNFGNVRSLDRKVIQKNALGFTSSGVWGCINGKQKFHRKHTFKRIKIK